MLERPLGGRGLLLGGVAGVAAGKVLVIGGGVSGTQAAHVAIGIGAEVYVADRSIERLRQLDYELAGRASTVFASTLAIEQLLPDMDLVIGAVLVRGAKAPRVITRAQLALMKRNAVLVDISIDQGGCFETSRPDDAHRPDLRGRRRDALLRGQHAGRRADHEHLRADELDDALRAEARGRRGRPPRWAPTRASSPA